MLSQKRKWLIAAAVLLILNIIVQFYNIKNIPPGLHYDEAYNGLDSYALLSKSIGQWPIFFTNNFGREPLFIYLLAGAQAIFGPEVWALRLVGGIIGISLTFALLWLLWEIAPSLGIDRYRALAWGSASTLVILWHLIFSHYIIRVELFALIEILLFASLWRAWHQKKWYWWGIAGVFGGLSFYTYIPSRILPFLLLPFLFWAFWRYRQQFYQNITGIGFGIFIAVLISAPLAIYFWQNPTSFWTRTQQVSLLHNGGIKAILENIKLVFGMIFWQGDQNVRNNIPGRPVFDPITAILFLLGLIFLLLKKWRRPSVAFLFLWLLIMLTPTMFSEYAPSFQRAIGAMPAFAIILVVGLDKLASWGESHLPYNFRRWYFLPNIIFVAIGIILTLNAYFLQWATPERLFYARDMGFMLLGEKISQVSSAQEQLYMSPRGNEHPTVRYTLLDSEIPQLQGFDGRVCLRISEKGPATYIFLEQEDFRGLKLLASYISDSTTEVWVNSPNGEVWARALKQPDPGSVQFPEMTPYFVQLDDGIELAGYWLSLSQLSPDQHLYVRLFWKALQSPTEDYTVFVHLLQKSNGSEKVVSGTDGQPGNGTCKTNEWLAGEFIVDEKELVLPPQLDADSEYYLEIGFYTLSDGKRLAIPGFEQNRILLGPLSH